MVEDAVVSAILKLIIAGLLGFLIGLERDVGSSERRNAELRDFVLISLLGAITGSVGIVLDTPWIVVAGFLGALAIIVSAFWVDYLNAQTRALGVTTELALLLTFFVGLIVALDHEAIAVAVVIFVLLTLSKRERLRTLRRATQRFELDAAVQLLVISFIVLPLLPRESLDQYLTVPMGTIESVSAADRSVTVELAKGQGFDVGDDVQIYDASRRGLGRLEITSATSSRITGTYLGRNIERIQPSEELRS